MAQVTHFENALRTRRFIYPNFFFHRCLVEMIMFPRSIVLLVKAMYQSAFLGLEFSQNTVVVITIDRCKIRKSVKFSRLHLFAFDDTDNLRKDDSLICLINLFMKGFKVLMGASAKVRISA